MERMLQRAQGQRRNGPPLTPEALGATAGMEISEGFQIEQPELFIPWEISEEKLQTILDGQPLHHVTDGYYTTHCISLGGLV